MKGRVSRGAFGYRKWGGKEGYTLRTRNSRLSTIPTEEEAHPQNTPVVESKGSKSRVEFTLLEGDNRTGNRRGYLVRGTFSFSFIMRRRLWDHGRFSVEIVGSWKIQLVKLEFKDTTFWLMLGVVPRVKSHSKGLGERNGKE